MATLTKPCCASLTVLSFIIVALTPGGTASQMKTFHHRIHLNPGCMDGWMDGSKITVRYFFSLFTVISRKTTSLPQIYNFVFPSE